jgi:hypothetical protein
VIVKFSVAYELVRENHPAIRRRRDGKAIPLLSHVYFRAQLRREFPPETKDLVRAVQLRDIILKILAEKIIQQLKKIYKVCFAAAVGAYDHIQIS